MPFRWVPLAAGGEFTQPRAPLLASPCMCGQEVIQWYTRTEHRIVIVKDIKNINEQKNPLQLNGSAAYLEDHNYFTPKNVSSHFQE